VHAMYLGLCILACAGGKNERSLVCFLIRQRQRRHRSDACTVICSSSKTYIFFPMDCYLSTREHFCDDACTQSDLFLAMTIYN